MKILWIGLLFIVGGIFVFYVVIFNPKSLKTLRRSGSKYHVSPLGAMSCGVLFFVIGMAVVLNGLKELTAADLRVIIWLAITQFALAGFYDTYRNWKLGEKSPFYVGKPGKRNDI